MYAQVMKDSAASAKAWTTRQAKAGKTSPQAPAKAAYSKVGGSLMKITPPTSYHKSPFDTKDLGKIKAVVNGKWQTFNSQADYDNRKKTDTDNIGSVATALGIL